MSKDLETFIRAAHAAGVARRLAELAQEVDAVIASYPRYGGARYLNRLIEQRRRLAAPDLALVAHLTAELCARDARVLTALLPLAQRLTADHPCLRKVTALADQPPVRKVA